MEVVSSALTIIESTRDCLVCCQSFVEAVDDGCARAASELLLTTCVHGHQYTRDAAVAEMALRQPPPVVLMTSDPQDMRTLCGDAVRVIPL